jgi:murein DD-endopeptidase MepM/ murein hydrolase activator NlpD
MIRTPEAYIRRQERRRREGKVIPPCVGAVLLRTFPISTPYRATGNPAWSLGHHTGEDHAAPQGSLCNAVSWGTVVCVSHWKGPGLPMVTANGSDVVQWGDAYGTHVVIRSKDDQYDYAYCHLSRTLVAPGMQVRPGQTIGHVGHTGGSGRFGNHLHLECRPKGGRFGTDVNPLRVKQMEV